MIMKKIRYSKYVPDPAGEMSMEDLLGALSDYLLQSGFDTSMYHEMPDGEQTLDALRQALERALLDSDMFDEEMRERLQQMQMDGTLDELIEKLIQRMEQEDYISIGEPPDPTRSSGVGGQVGENQTPTKFEITDKSLDFLGYKSLRDLLGSLGKSSFGRHDTRDMATGVEASGASKIYEFGDTLNLDAASTLLNAVERNHRDREREEAGAIHSSPRRSDRGGSGPRGTHRITVTHEDLMVVQGEYQSSCATVLMLDCSHSMILYGEDRFTPAKRVALALAQLIKVQYPGDALKVVLFHDSAEEIPLAELGRVRVGPYYTNTREGLRLARRILDRQSKDMRQIIMITDGKPSALTQPDGRIYKNAFGLDPFIVAETCAEVAACRRSGIMINTFMLARDYDLVSFVRRVAEICKGKAYFTTPYTLGQYVLMDYMDKKTKTIH